MYVPCYIPFSIIFQKQLQYVTWGHGQCGDLMLGSMMLTKLTLSFAPTSSIVMPRSPKPRGKLQYVDRRKINIVLTGDISHSASLLQLNKPFHKFSIKFNSYLFIYLTLHLSIYLAIHLFICSDIHLFIQFLLVIFTELTLHYIHITYSSSFLLQPLEPYYDLCENWGLCAYDRFTALKTVNPELKTLLSVGGNARLMSQVRLGSQLELYK